MRVLCVAAHPDDEGLGCGGTLRKHVLAGDEVHVLLLSGAGVMLREIGQMRVLSEQAKAAAARLGYRLSIDGFPDQRFDELSLLDIIQRVEAELSAVEPEIVYTHSLRDLNQDHVLTARAVLTACRPQGACPVKRLLSFEIPSSSEWSSDTFKPTVFSPLTGALMDEKIAALCEYAGEMRPAPHPRSVDGIRALASWRGATVGAEYAEAFALVREIG